tara:strand:- start:2539 stop:2955 length:417 start_codon:yes stop_codon:yes gene_type:complete
MENIFSFIARLFLASMFFVTIILILNTMLITPNGYAIYQDMLGARGLPGIFAPISVIVQFVFGLTLILGYKTKLSAYVLSAYSLIWTLVYFFSALSGEPQNIMKSLQYLAITGGLLHLAINSSTSYSLDNLCAAKKKK